VWVFVDMVCHLVHQVSTDGWMLHQLLHQCQLFLGVLRSQHSKNDRLSRVRLYQHLCVAESPARSLSSQQQLTFCIELLKVHVTYVTNDQGTDQ
jgi:hypothetical protein